MFGKKNKVTSGNYSDEYEFTNRNRYKINVQLTGSTIEDAQKSYKLLCLQNIKRLRENPNRATTLQYFDHIMTKFQPRVKELQEFKTTGGKVIGVFCVQVPEELIYAAGCVPIRLSCGFYDAISPAEEIIPSNTCPMVKASMGFPYLKINPFFDMCDAVIIPTTCDGKKKMCEVMSNYKHVWPLELPQNRDHLEARDQWIAQIELLKKKLERLTGKKVVRSELENATKRLQFRTQVFRDFLETKKSDKIVINGRDTLLVTQSAFNDDLERWMKYLQSLTKELKDNIQQNKTIAKDSSRIMVTGSPMMWPTWKVMDALEESGGTVVIDDSCAGSQYFYNTVEVPDWSMKSMIAGIADKYLLPTICPIFIHSDDRVDRIMELSEQYKAQGVVYHILRLCQLIDFEYNKVASVMKKKGMPLLRIETEFGQEDMGQIKTRAEAFIEMMKARE